MIASYVLVVIWAVIGASIGAQSVVGDGTTIRNRVKVGAFVMLAVGMVLGNYVLVGVGVVVAGYIGAGDGP